MRLRLTFLQLRARLLALLPPSVRGSVRNAVAPILGRIGLWRTSHLTARERWDRALPTEIAFWRAYVQGMSPEERTSYPRRYDYAWSEDGVFARVAEQMPLGRVEVLDVGAGPLAGIPRVLPGRDVHITAVDPLADEYNAVLDECGIDPVVRTRRGTGEELLNHVPAGTFDLAHAANCLDHAYDPALAIRNMVLAVRPGGVVLLRHEQNEGVVEHYLGLHQWNFDLDGVEFVLWRPDTPPRNLSRELAEMATGEAFVREQPSGAAELVWIVRRLER